MVRCRCAARVAAAALLLVTAAAGRAAAQDAIVLSGGGARGLAHIGALLVLGEHGYDPAIVVGNSMGAVVGALYAAGYDAAEIREKTLAIDWGGMFDPTPLLIGPTRDLRLPQLTFSLDFAGGEVSRGLFGEWRANRALVNLLFEANARARGDFDRLPRRFRAIAADLETGERVALGTGDIARATRASMAYPGFFAPVRIGERLLVDGGIADNLPTLEARRLGAARIVAVDVAQPPRQVGSLAPLAVAQRSLGLMQRNLHPDPRPPDLLVLPRSEGALAGPAFPDDPRPHIELGITTTRAALDSIPLARTSRADLRATPAPPARFDALRVQAPDSARTAVLRQALGRHAPGPYDPRAVLAALDRLYATGLFDGLWPRVEGDGAAATLVVEADAPASLLLSLGAGFDNDRGGRAWANLERYTPIAGRPGYLGGALSTDGLQRWVALSARLHPLARPALALSTGAHLREHSVRTYEEDVRSTEEVLRSGAWLGLELPWILRERVITLTAYAERIDPESSEAFLAAGPAVRVADVPAQNYVVGTPLLLEAEARWGDRHYRRATVAGSLRRAGRRLQAALLIDARMTGGAPPPDVLPALGDQHAIPGLRWGERRARTRALAGIDLALAVPLGGHARLRARAGAGADEPQDWSRARWIAGAQLGGVWRTPFGLLEAGYGHATIGDGRFDLSLGRAF